MDPGDPLLPPKPVPVYVIGRRLDYVVITGFVVVMFPAEPRIEYTAAIRLLHDR
jgi:hypothetical protein